MYTSEKLTRKDTYSKTINLVNSLFKKNIQVSYPVFNTNLNSTDRNIFNYNNILIRSIEDFNDISFSLGYVSQDGQGDIKEFLRNCIVRIDNVTKINTVDIVSNKSCYFFLGRLFNIDNIDNDIIYLKNQTFKDYIETDDFFQFTNKKNTVYNKNLLEFFLSSSEDKYKLLTKYRNLTAESSLVIKVLPIPKIISLYRGKGLDSLGNPIDNNLYSDSIDNIEETKRKISRELVQFFYSNNSNLNYNKFNKYKSIIFNEIKSDDPTNYSEFFNYLINFNVEKENIFKYNTTYNNEDILKEINADILNYISSDLITSFKEENIFEKYFDFGIDNREIFYENFPYSIVYRDANYNSIVNEYDIDKITFLKNINSSLMKIDITNLTLYFSETDLLEITPDIRVSVHFLLNDDLDLDNLEVSNTDFVIVQNNSNNYITYNKSYIEKNISSFSNFYRTIDSSLIDVQKENNKLFININSSNSSINLNNIEYSYYNDFFTFAKSRNINKLKEVIFRTSISFDVPNSSDAVTAIFNKEIPSINLNKKIKNIKSLITLETVNSNS